MHNVSTIKKNIKKNMQYNIQMYMQYVISHNTGGTAVVHVGGVVMFGITWEHVYRGQCSWLPTTAV